MLLALSLTLCLRIAATFDQGGWLLPVFVVAFLTMCFYAPPVAGSYLVFGYVFMFWMDWRPMGGLPRLPATSLMAVTIIVGLLAAAVRRGRIKTLLSAPVVFYGCLFLCVFALGFLGIVRHGQWGNTLVRYLAWQKFMSCAPMLILGLLSCRNLDDLRVAVFCFPIWFLMWIVYIPMDTYMDFFSTRLFGWGAYNVGLQFGALNVNTLGQGACVVAVVALALWCHTAGGARSKVYGWFFLIGGVIVLASAARQALLGLGVGMMIVLFRWRPLAASLFGLALLISVVLVGGWIQNREDDYGYFARLGDLGKPAEEWSTGSVSVRMLEIRRAWEHIPASPWVGFGFGGYSLEETVPDAVSVIEITELGYVGRLWTAGFYLEGEHNFPTALMVQTGGIGVICFGTLVIGPYIWLRRRLRQLPANRRREYHPVAIALLSAGVSLFVLQNISGGFGLGSMSILLFFVGALIAGCAGEGSVGRPSANDFAPEGRAEVTASDPHHGTLAFRERLSGA